jgi:cyclopropane fatty-acyl-phospholipid synthase-like methyltransferase
MIRRLKFNLRYYQQPPWDTGISPPELMAFIQSHPPGKALDIGCGTGTNVITLAKNGWKVSGVDFAWQAIRIARKKAGAAGVKVDLSVDDATQLRGFSGPYDLILDIGCFHSLLPEGRIAYIENITRLLAPQGTFLLYTFFKQDANVEGPGVPETEITQISDNLELVSRINGTERGKRPSAWFTYRKN